MRTDLRRLVVAEAAGQLTVLERRRARVERLRVLPWHGGVRDARSAVLVHAGARAAALRAAAQGTSAAPVDEAAARAALAAVSSPRRAAAVYG